MKKIGILTQPLHNNYGGLLQNFALQKFLTDKNYDVLTIDFNSDKKARFWGVKGITLNIIRKFIFRENIRHIFPISKNKQERISINTDRFKLKNIKLTKRISNSSELQSLSEYKFYGYIVGSDQVWRPSYSPGISAFFLDFIKGDTKIKKISYAASFGLDNSNEYSKEQILIFSQLLKKFNAVSVREDSGIEICNQIFGVSASHVIDPTLLLDKSDYINLVNAENEKQSNGELMVYILDSNPEKQKIINKVSEENGLKAFSVMPDIINEVYPPVTEWLRGFMDAKYVVTDSFHGMVFSIIFNKQFLAIGNKNRGLSRFSSLLKKFNLESRLVNSFKDVTTTKINETIDFNKVNQLLKSEQNFAWEFLKDSLED